MGTMWRQWATVDNIIKAAKRVGISAKGLNVDDMQQEKFSKPPTLQTVLLHQPCTNKKIIIQQL